MTEFESTIEKVKPMFEASGFKEVESYRNFMRLDSQSATVVIAYDERENYNILGVGLRNHWDFLGPESLNEVFGYNKPSNNFADFIIDFFKTKGNGILGGDVVKLRELNNYVGRQAEAYTKDLLRRQYISAADSAWASKDYSAFIRAIDKVDKVDLPDSYKLKYKMANDRVAKLNK